ncbi:hypothetical protein DEU56DRAFT_565087 [Suillus clintonianus]|uniref:uncharacterized protein n=1 Tax=Suillus clintonianus TaxID=1904413 RepID=UPI001B86EDCD|nr:uncharacterized protein DEU56DRAFT_565087 [Suillus clintonianus]KAG2125762.1 hypothetical protein DEU56DRAFT_565087 [Suillus clintonianus]
MLSCPSTPASIFPNLRKLRWRADGTQCAAQFLRVALVPTLLDLDINISSPSSICFLSVLSSLGTLCPHLLIIHMRSPSATNDLLHKISPFIVQSISQLHHLKTLLVWDLGNQGNEQLMQLRALRKLGLYLKSSSAWERRSHLRFPGFHDLYSLVIRSKRIEIRFLTNHASTSPSTMLSHFFTILGETCDHDNLESFAVPNSPGKIHTKPDVFTPMHSCYNLTQLLINSSWNISMADEELCQLVRSWPKLQVLEISRFVTIDDTTIPTFHGLIGLLQLCPALTSLTLVVDTTTLDSIDLSSPGGGACSRNLKELVLSNSPIDSPLHVALILSGLFPYLKQVDLDCWDSAPATLPRQSQTVKKQWEEVNLALFSFSVVKERRVEVS